jgi:hypothetical protein
MTPEQFTYWLQGFMEIFNPTNLDERQTQIIKDHLNLVFEKATPNRDNIKDPYHIKPSFTPVWETDPNIFRPICETPIQTETDPMKVKYCTPSEILTSHMIPQGMFGKKEEDTIGTDSLKVVNEKKKFRGGLKC